MSQRRTLTPVTRHSSRREPPVALHGNSLDVQTVTPERTTTQRPHEAATELVDNIEPAAASALPPATV